MCCKQQTSPVLTKRQQKWQRQQRNRCLGLTQRDDDLGDASMGNLIGRNKEESESSDVDDKTIGLRPPILESSERVNGLNKRRLRRENKQKRLQRQAAQTHPSYWATHEGKFEEPTAMEELDEYLGEISPRGLALYHPAAAQLLQYATGDCPINSGQPWTLEMINTAIERGAHVSAMVPEAIEQLEAEAIEKKRKGRWQLVVGKLPASSRIIYSLHHHQGEIQSPPVLLSSR